MKTIGKYQVLQEIGRSAAGATFRVHDPFRKRDLALKVLSPLAALSDQAKDQLYRQLAACEELSHRHVARILDLGEVEGGVYIATELLRGTDLRGHLASPDAPIAQQLTLMAQVCEGIAAAHAKGIAHGNLKPSNIFVVDGRDAVILDLGVGCWQNLLIAAGARLNGLLPNYLAPEQILGQDFDARSDLFSLAVVLYEMLAGRYPFEAPAGVVPREIVHSEPTPLRTLNPQVPEELEQTLVRALKKDPKSRLETANELAASLYASALQLRRHQPTPPANGSAPDSAAGDLGKAETAAPAPTPEAVAPPSSTEILALVSATGTRAPADETVTAAPTATTETAAPVQSTDPEPAPSVETTACDLATEPLAVAVTAPPAAESAPAPIETAAPLQSAFGFPPATEPSGPAPAPQIFAPVVANETASATAAVPQAIAAQPAAPAPPPTPQLSPGAAWPTASGPASPAQPVQRKAPAAKPISLRRRIFVVAVAAALAIWAMATIISRQNLHASQDKTVQPAVQTPSAATPPVQATPEPPAPVPVETAPAPEPAPQPKKVDSAPARSEQILRVQVKAMWEAGRYAEAMRLVDSVLDESPSNAEARAWKTRIRAAQDAEAAMK
ncbi:MAG: protein kinase [Acidobacteriia bacterium]|nr:protein kinase [Terriglobia bacterium]